MSKEKSKKNSEKEVKVNLPDEVSGTSPAKLNGDKILDSVVETQEQVSAEVTQRLDELAKKDSAGQIFNPDIHAIDSSGEPAITGKGKFRMKKRRKDVITDEDIQRKSVSETSAGLFIQGGVTLFGDEWEPDDSKEFDRLVLAFDNYYKSVGVKYIPPSLGLVVGMGGYAIKRFSKPDTKTKMKRIRDNVKNRIVKIFRRKKAM